MKKREERTEKHKQRWDICTTLNRLLRNYLIENLGNYLQKKTLQISYQGQTLPSTELNLLTQGLAWYWYRVSWHAVMRQNCTLLPSMKNVHMLNFCKVSNMVLKVHLLNGARPRVINCWSIQAQNHLWRCTLWICWKKPFLDKILASQLPQQTPNLSISLRWQKSYSTFHYNFLL